MVLETSGYTQIRYRIVVCDPMDRRDLVISTKELVVLVTIMGNFNILFSTTTVLPVFSTVSTSVDQGQLSEPSAANGSSLFQQIEEH